MIQSCWQLPSPQGNQLLYLVRFANSEETWQLCLSLHCKKYQPKANPYKVKTTLVPSEQGAEVLVACDNGVVPPCEVYGTCLDFYMRVMVEAPPGREFLLVFRFLEHNNMFEMKEVKSDTFAVYSTVKFDNFENATMKELPFPISMTPLKEKDKDPSHPGKVTIKVGNYVPGLMYLLGPYRLPVIFENKQDLSVICVIPDHPIKLIQEYLNQSSRVAALKKSASPDSQASDDSDKKCMIGELKQLDLVLSIVSHVGPNKFISSGPQLIFHQYNNDLLTLFQQCTQLMMDSEVMAMKRKASTFQEILKKTDNLDVLSKAFHLSLKSLLLPETNLTANVKASAMEEFLQTMINVGWVEYDAELSQLFPYPADYPLVSKIFFWTLNSGLILFFRDYQKKKLDISVTFLEEAKTFKHFDPLFLGGQKHIENKIEVKRPVGAVQRLLQKLENNDEKEIINNLKEANKFEDYEHLLELDSDDSDDEVDRMLKREEEKIENQEEESLYEEVALAPVSVGPSFLRDLTLQNSRGETILLDQFNLEQIDELVIDQSQFNVNLSAFLDQNDFIIETFEESAQLDDGSIKLLPKVRASRRFPRGFDINAAMAGMQNDPSAPPFARAPVTSPRRPARPKLNEGGRSLLKESRGDRPRERAIANPFAKKEQPAKEVVAVEPQAEPEPEEDVDSIINELLDENERRPQQQANNLSNSSSSKSAPVQHVPQRVQHAPRQASVDVDSLVDELMTEDEFDAEGDEEQEPVLSRISRLDLSTRLPDRIIATTTKQPVLVPTTIQIHPNPATRPPLNQQPPSHQQPPQQQVQQQQQLPALQLQPQNPYPQHFHQGRTHAEPRQHVQVREVEVKELKRMSGERRKQALASKHQQMMLQQHQQQQQNAADGSVSPRGGQIHSLAHQNSQSQLNKPQVLPQRKPLPTSTSQGNLLSPNGNPQVQQTPNLNLQQQSQGQMQQHQQQAVSPRNNNNEASRDIRSKSTGIVNEHQHIQQQQPQGQTRPISKSGTAARSPISPRIEQKQQPNQQQHGPPNQQQSPQTSQPHLNVPSNLQQQQNPNQRTQPVVRPPSGSVPVKLASPPIQGRPHSNGTGAFQQQPTTRPGSNGSGSFQQPTTTTRPGSNSASSFQQPTTRPGSNSAGSFQQPSQQHQPSPQAQPILVHSQSMPVLQVREAPQQQQPQLAPQPVQQQGNTTKYILEPAPIPQLLGSPRGNGTVPTLPSRAVQMQPGQTLSDFLAQQQSQTQAMGGTVSARVVSPRQANPFGPTSNNPQPQPNPQPVQQSTSLTTSQPDLVRSPTSPRTITQRNLKASTDNVILPQQHSQPTQQNPNHSPPQPSKPAPTDATSPRGATSPRTISAGNVGRNFVQKSSTDNFNVNPSSQPSPQPQKQAAPQVIHRPHTWDKQRVQTWLVEIDFAEFGANLKYTDGKALLTLTKSELLEMGIPLQAAIPLLAQIEDLKVQTAGLNYGSGAGQSASAKIMTTHQPLSMHVQSQNARPGSTPLPNNTSNRAMSRENSINQNVSQGVDDILNGLIDDY